MPCIRKSRMKGPKSSFQAIFRAPAQGARPEEPFALWKDLAADFPSLAFAGGAPAPELPSLALTAEPWESQSFNFYALDAAVDALAESRDAPFALVLAGFDGPAARAALTRCQRWADRRNKASRGPLFNRVLRRHREAHDLAKPLVRADYDHALDTWQWLLRLAPEAGLAVQLAALLHDVERLISEADSRVEHRAADYQAFKDRHAARGAELAESLLAETGVDAETRRRTAWLIALHEGPPAADDPDAEAISLLNDADALSFFSLNSPGYLDYFGPEPTRKKVTYTLRRLRPEARSYLTGMRLPDVVAET
ncbi:MAG TPA: DUF4202 family protein, partial [Thermoanaerobaculia bacterium]